MQTQFDPQIPSARRCFLLELPAELRNRIYELSFQASAGDSAGIDFRDVDPPCKNLTLTNQQIHRESRGFYKSRFREYWCKNTFVLDLRQSHGPVHQGEQLAGLKHLDIDHMAQCYIFYWDSCGEIGFVRASCSGERFWQIDQFQSAVSTQPWKTLREFSLWHYGNSLQPWAIERREPIPGASKVSMSEGIEWLINFFVPEGRAE